MFASISPDPDIQSSLIRVHSPVFPLDETKPSPRILIARFDPARDPDLLVEPH
jgi:hypothetical protein